MFIGNLGTAEAIGDGAEVPLPTKTDFLLLAQ